MEEQNALEEGEGGGEEGVGCAWGVGEEIVEGCEEVGCYCISRVSNLYVLLR